MPELVVLVNQNNHPLGTADKLKIHTQNTPLHRGFSVFVFNQNGQLLLQKRSSGKITWPGIWSNSCCGHPLPGEKNIQAVKRRLKEELGLIKTEIYETLPDYRYCFSYQGIMENEICPVFVAFTNQKPVINKKEIDYIKWIDWKSFLKEIKARPQNYSPWCVEESGLLSKNKLFLRLYSLKTAAKWKSK